jgi:uncharacterized protein involved in exopolysaccharide biosynthesis
MPVFGEIVHLFAAYFWRMALAFVIALGVLGYFLVFSPKVYESSALVLYKLGRDYIYIPDTFEDGARAPDPGDLSAIVNAEMQIMNSGRLRYQVVEEMGGASIYPVLAELPEAEANIAAGEMLSRSTSVSLITGSHIVRLAVRHEQPEMAAQLTERILDAYFQRRASYFGSETAEQIREEMTSTNRSLRRVQQEISTLLDGRSILDFNTERDITLAEQRRLREELILLDSSIAEAAERRMAIEAEIEMLEPTIVEAQDFQINNVVSELRGQIAVRRAERRAMAGRLGDSHPDVRALDIQIEGIEAAIAEEPLRVLGLERSVVNPLLGQARAELMQLRFADLSQRSRRAFLERRIEENSVLIARIAELEPRVAVLQSRINSQRDTIARLSRRLQEIETETEIGVDVRNISVIEPPAVPVDSAGAPRSILAVVALILAGFVSLAVGAAGYLTRLYIATGVMAARVANLPNLGEISRRRALPKPIATPPRGRVINA